MVTIDDLKELRSIREELSELAARIEDLAYPVHSPRAMGMKQKNLPGDPTAQAAYAVMGLKAEYWALYESLAHREREIVAWLRTLPDGDLRRIIIGKYIDGKTWTQVTKEVMHCEYSDSAKHIVYRYFGLK